MVMNALPSTPISISSEDRTAFGLRSNAIPSSPRSYFMSSAAGNPIRLVGAKSRSANSSITPVPEDKMSEHIVQSENDASGSFIPDIPMRVKSKSLSYPSVEWQRDDISGQDLDNLGHHTVLATLTRKPFSSSRIDSTKGPLMKELQGHNIWPLAANEEDDQSEMSESYNNISLNPETERVVEGNRPKTLKAALLKKFLTKSHTIASLANPVKSDSLRGNGKAISDADYPFDELSLLSLTRKPHVRFEQAPPPGEDEAKRIIPKVVMDTNDAQSMSQADVDELLESMLPVHAAEFMADQERLHKDEYSEVEYKKRELLGYRSRDYVGCVHERPKKMSLCERGIRIFNGESPAPEPTDDYCSECERERTIKRADIQRQEAEYRRQEMYELWEVVTPRRPLRRRPRLESFSRTEIGSAADTTVTEEFYRPSSGIQAGITLNHLNGGPSQMYVTDINPAPVPSFGCIFTVWIPVLNVEAAVSQHGRPLIHENVEFDKYTVTASYHHHSRQVVMDMMDITLCPLGFSTDQIIDLIYLQKGGYLPPYVVWPVPSQSSRDIVLADQWSLCRPALSGLDVLHTSDVDVMVQRIAGALFRLGATANMPFHNRQRFLGALSCDCDEEVNVTFKVSTRNWHQDRFASEVPVSFAVNAHFDWHLPTSEQLAFGHSRNSHPLGLEMSLNDT